MHVVSFFKTNEAEIKIPASFVSIILFYEVSVRVGK